MGFWLGQNPGVYVDCTLGGGGHSAALLPRLEAGSVLHGFDRDSDALNHAKGILQSSNVAISLHHCAFAELSSCLSASSADGILYDLGVSSHQLDEDSRGFSLAASKVPLDLRMDLNDSLDAQTWLRDTDADTMAHVFRAHSDLDRAHALARKVKEVVDLAISEGEAITAAHLRTAVDRIFRDRRFDQNSLMARLLQAVRMEINQEMPQLEQSLAMAVDLLRPGGNLCVISYHSVEDRKVKTTLARYEQDCICPPRSPQCICGGNHRKLRKVLRKPMTPADSEMRDNPRSRSAKLRVYQRV